MTRTCLLAAALVAAGCAADPRDFNRAPAMSAVGSGLAAHQVPPPLAVPATSAPRDPESLWSPTTRSLFGDQRALHVGDILTVEISLDEKAEFDNRSDRSRDSVIGLDFGLDVPEIPFSTTLGGNLGSNSGSFGRGSTERSEALDVTVPAVVTGVLPNGNLVISGSQETRVNYELRVVGIAGIVRPFDISRNNTIPYEKIAEGRLTYGGRGRLSEVQQPAYGQQLYDFIIPF